MEIIIIEWTSITMEIIGSEIYGVKSEFMRVRVKFNRLLEP